MSAHEAHVPSRDEVVSLITRPIPRRLATVGLVLAVIGFAIFLVGVFTGSARAWQAFHVNWLFFTTISSAGVAIAAAQRITTARWSRPTVRIIEGFVAWLPVAFLLLLLIVVFGKRAIFPWMTEPPPQPEKALWLDPTFFTIRTLVVFGLITWLSLWFVYRSVRLDVGIMPEWGAGWAKGLRDRMRAGFGEERRELHSTHSTLGKLAVVLALVFGFGWTMLAWDLSMSVDYHFYSTMYGWQVFMGGWVAALMVQAILVRLWRNALGADELILERHFHDIGKLCFAFTAFWGYLTFSQFLVIWYGNMPEETHFLFVRMSQPWVNLTVAVAILMFAVPFFGLLSKSAKVYTPTMVLFALCSIVGLWLQRYVEIYPSIYAGGDAGHAEPAAEGAAAAAVHLPFGLYEVGVTLGFLGLWIVSYLAFMNAFPRMRVFMMTSPYRDEVQVPVNPETMEPLPAHE
ncbi:MAG TPA: hypothetical protein VFZ21_22335 [Gemmatimonadaceae bacterium]|jgi:hypothetical protein|nr:hypothetical protein [Gemmatimonadaceae bacterium]